MRRLGGSGDELGVEPVLARSAEDRSDLSERNQSQQLHAQEAISAVGAASPFVKLLCGGSPKKYRIGTLAIPSSDPRTLLVRRRITHHEDIRAMDARACLTDAEHMETRAVIEHELHHLDLHW